MGVHAPWYSTQGAESSPLLTAEEQTRHQRHLAL